jgi:hypothetical protein
MRPHLRPHLPHPDPLGRMTRAIDAWADRLAPPRRTVCSHPQCPMAVGVPGVCSCGVTVEDRDRARLVGQRGGGPLIDEGWR